MKRLILAEIILLFLATTFKSDSTGGWVQQTLPINNTINDIFFSDSLNGWTVTQTSVTDTMGYVIHTTNGGSNWEINYADKYNFNVVQFLDLNNGYVFAKNNSLYLTLFKTTNSGANWQLINNIQGINSSDLFFINRDEGWVCDVDGAFGAGLLKTTNAGATWVQQLNSTYRPKKLFFINKDTGWVGSNDNKLYKTINSGINWNLQFTFSSALEDVFFVSKDTGWVTGGGGGTGIMKTINGGNNWSAANNPTPFGQSRLFFINNKRGWAGSGQSKIVATIDGVNWGYQTTPNFTHYSVFFVDSIKGWSGGGGSDIIYTTDGGGVINSVHQISNEVPKDFALYQNYPNPFNPSTVICYQLRVNSGVKIIVYDITGKEISKLVDQKQITGTYQVDFSATGGGSSLPTGVYFYSLIIDGNIIDTKKMILIK